MEGSMPRKIGRALLFSLTPPLEPQRQTAQTAVHLRKFRHVERAYPVAQFLENACNNWNPEAMRTSSFTRTALAA